MTLVAKIDRDYINLRDSEYNRVGKEFELNGLGFESVFPNGLTTKIRFRVLDDDDIVYYGGWLYNDLECEVQQHVIEWAERDAGAVKIQIWTDEGWIYEIG